jgi:sugar/nucleoside kinase (ribokinase family)
MVWPSTPAHAFRHLLGVGGIGTGLVFALDGTHTLGRTESRAARLLPVRDYCKLHIITHYLAVLRGSAIRVRPIGCVGDDPPGRQVIHEMESVGIDTTFVTTHATLPTLLSVCFEYPDGDGGNVTDTGSACATVSVNDVDRAVDAISSDDAADDLIVLAVPETAWSARRRLLELGTTLRALRVAVFTASEIRTAVTDGSIAMTDLIAMNREEAEALIGTTLDFAAVAAALTAVQPDIRIVVTAGSDGAFAFINGTWIERGAVHVGDAHTAGAGDALVGGMLAAMTVGAPIVSRDAPGSLWGSALDFGVLLAAFSVTSPHSIHPDLGPRQLRQFADAHGVRFAEPIASELLA